MLVYEITFKKKYIYIYIKSSTGLILCIQAKEIIEGLRWKKDRVQAKAYPEWI